MGAKRRPWLYHEEFMDGRLGVRPTGVVWIDGSEVWEFQAEGTTDADSSTLVSIIGLPAGAGISKVLPMSPAVSIELAANIWIASSSVDAVDLALVVLAVAFDISISHSASFQSKPYRLSCQFTLV